MKFSLLLQLCGLPLIIVLAVLASVLTLFVLVLAIRFQRTDLLTAFLPLTALPLAAGLASSLVGSLDSIGLQLDPGTDYEIEPAFFLQMNLVPVLVSIHACLPPFLTAIVARWLLAYRISGVRLFPERAAPPPTDSDQETWVAREADDYLEKLVRPK